MIKVPCTKKRQEAYVSTLGFIVVFLAALLAPLPCRGLFNAGLFILGLFFIYHG